jgi:hypothetical protein
MIRKDKVYYAEGNYTLFLMPGEAIKDIAQPGANDEAVAYWAARIPRYPFGEDHVWAPTPERVRTELREYGAWDETELQDDAENWRRLVWVFAHNLSEEENPEAYEPGN